MSNWKYFYTVPTDDKSISSVKSSVLAVGVALFFLYLVNYIFQGIVTFVLDREEKQRNRIKQKLLQTSRVLYLYVIATMFSIYPPFYYGPHSALLSWLTLIVAILMHIFCIVEKSCKQRTMWAYMYFIYHLLIAFWIFLALVIGFSWSNKQDAYYGEL